MDKHVNPDVNTDAAPGRNTAPGSDVNIDTAPDETPDTAGANGGQENKAGKAGKKGSAVKARRAVLMLLVLLIAVMPVIAYAAAARSVRGVFANTFTAALQDKYGLLKSAEGAKIVVVGGSSVCFGLVSPLLEQETGMPVVDFGLYATLGTRLMLDLSEREIGKGDIVILAPELDRQTLSMYFNGEACLEAFDGDLSMLSGLRSDTFKAVAGSFPGYVSRGLSLLKAGTVPDPQGVYNRRSFNANGDIVYPRQGNVMTLGYDPNRLVALTPDILAEDFADYLSRYVRACREKGAKVYFTFCPVNEDSLAEDTTAESIYDFYRFLGEKLECRIISDINDYILPQEYFYDTNFHLNDDGAVLRTYLLARDLKRELGDNSQVMIELPDTAEPSETPDVTPIGGSDGIFIYEGFGKGCEITGVTEAGRGMTKIDIPREFNGRRIYSIGKDAFSGCGKLEEITVHDNITLIRDGAFEIPSLKRVFIDVANADDLEAGERIFGDLTGAEIVLNDAESFGSFVSGYWWSIYAGRMRIG